MGVDCQLSSERVVDRNTIVSNKLLLYACLSLAVRCAALCLEGGRGRDQPQRPHDFGHLRCVLGFVHAPSASFPHFFEHVGRLSPFRSFFRSFFAHFLIFFPHARFCLHLGAGAAVRHREYPESHREYAPCVVGDRHRCTHSPLYEL